MAELTEAPGLETSTTTTTNNAPAPGTAEYIKGMGEAFRNAIQNKNGNGNFKQQVASTEEKKETTTNKETTENKGTESTTQNTTHTTTQTTAETKPADTPPALTAEQLLHEFNKINGTSFRTIDEIKSIQTERDNYKRITDGFADLTKEERALLKAGREKNDYSYYSKVTGISLDGMQPKDVLRTKFILDNPGKNPDLLAEKFEREYRQKYMIPVPSEEDGGVENEEYKQEYNYRKLLLDDDSNDAKKHIASLQEQIKKYGDVEGVTSRAEQEQKIQQKAAELKTGWTNAVDKTLDNAPKVQYTITPKDSKDAIPVNLTMDAVKKADMRAAMENPVAFLEKQIGFNAENYTFDPQKLFEYVLRELNKEEERHTIFMAGANWKHEQLRKEAPGARQTASPGDTKTTRQEEHDKNKQALQNRFGGGGFFRGL